MNYARPSLNPGLRFQISLAVLVAAFLMLLGRLWELQVLHGDYFRQRSENNRLRTVYVQAPRGMVFDRNGNVLVRNRPSFNIELVPEDSPNPRKVVSDVARLLKLEPEELLARYDNQRRRMRFEPKIVLRDVSRDVVALVAAHRYRLPGVVIAATPAREYVRGELGSHVLGYLREVTSDQLKRPEYAAHRTGDLIGQAGVEQQLEQLLRGERGVQVVTVNANGTRIGESSFKAEIPGHNVYLSLDARVQAAAEHALEGKRGAVVALDVRSGEVIAMASAPTFNPNVFSEEMNKDYWAALTSPSDRPLSNRATQGAYHPGSVFKIFMSVAALAENVVNDQTSYFCPGFFRFGGRAFRCHKHSGHGRVSLEPALTMSCDVYYYSVGQLLGVDRINHYSEMFGLNRRTGVGLTNEVAGLIPSTAWKRKRFKGTPNQRWFPGETVSVSIGQGAVTTTPIQIARSVAAVVNGGKVLTPIVIKKIVSVDGRVLEENNGPVVESTVTDTVSDAVLMKVRKAMESVVNNPRGTGKRSQLPPAYGVKLGGKTGTAQVVGDGKGRGERFDDHAWFVGYAPVEAPQIVAVALIENGGHGGETAAPVVKEVFESYFADRLPILGPEERPKDYQEPKEKEPKESAGKKDGKDKGAKRDAKPAKPTPRAEPTPAETGEIED